jgi:hypothetical protein
MNALRRRLQKLERVIVAQPPSFADQFVAVNETAFAKLSVADRDLLQGTTSLRGDERTVAHEAAWNRWEIALAATRREMACPFYIDAADWWL